jgi:hypothetical protein
MKPKYTLPMLLLATITACTNIPKEEIIDTRFLNKDFANIYAAQNINMMNLEINDSEGEVVCFHGPAYLKKGVTQLKFNNCEELKVNDTAKLKFQTLEYGTIIDTIPISY